MRFSDKRRLLFYRFVSKYHDVDGLDRRRQIASNIIVDHLEKSTENIEY
ncbi:MAG: hypothetical protein P8184_06890 [Calditrichia bacterium]